MSIAAAINDPVFLSRVQFGLTAGFHMIWPVLSIGLSLYLVFLEALWLKRKNPLHYRHLRFWTRLFVLCFAIGVATGVPMEFQFGTNWGPFAAATNGFFGHILGFEASMAFMLEAAFLGVMLFGWKRAPAGLHFFATCMVAVGTSLSAFWIMAANSWMQTPAGGVMGPEGFMVTDYFAAIFTPDLFWAGAHMWLACLETTAFAVGGVSAWYLLRRRMTGFFLPSFKHAIIATILLAPLQFLVGDGQGVAVAHHQPAKLAAIEAHWETNPPGEAASWHIVAWPDREKQENAFEISIPYGLSLIITKTFTGQVRGLRDFPLDEQPPILIPFYSFRVMLGIGSLMILVMLLSLWSWRKGRLKPEVVDRQGWLLWLWVALGPLGIVAVEAGWMMREVGRQPWTIYGLMRTQDAATALPQGSVLFSLLAFCAVYAVLLLLFLVIGRRVISQGPDLNATPPTRFKA